MIVAVMPYVKFARKIRTGPQGPIEVSKVKLWADTDGNWKEATGHDRPGWLGILREYKGTEVGDPARGTLIVSDDDTWLQDNIRRLAAVLHFLGYRSSSNILPAERFAYRLVRLPGTDEVCFVTKRERKIESPDECVILPPLEAKGPNSLCRIDTARAEHRRLLSLFDKNPTDRLVTAVVHFFESQFESSFTSPVNHDYVCYCACLEAALGIDSQRGLHEKVAAELSGIYRRDKWFLDWIYGLYMVRAAQVHGLDPSRKPEEKKIHDKFLSMKDNMHVCAVLAHDVLLEKLRTSGRYRPLPPGVREYTRSGKILSRSEKIWGCIRKRLSMPQSAKVLSALEGPAWQKFCREAKRFDSAFNWACVQKRPDDKQILKHIRTLLSAAVKCSPSDDLKQTMDKLDAAVPVRDEEWAAHVYERIRDLGLQLDGIEVNAEAKAATLMVAARKLASILCR